MKQNKLVPGAWYLVPGAGCEAAVPPTKGEGRTLPEFINSESVASVEMLPIANANVANLVGRADSQIQEAGTAGLETGTGNTGNIGNNPNPKGGAE